MTILTLLSLAHAASDLTVNTLWVTASPTAWTFTVSIKNTGTSTSGAFNADLLGDERVMGLMASGYVSPLITPGVVDPTVDPTDAQDYISGLMASGYPLPSIGKHLYSAGFGADEALMGLMASGYAPGPSVSAIDKGGFGGDEAVMGLMASGYTAPEAVCLAGSVGVTGDEAVMGLMASGRPRPQIALGLVSCGHTLDESVALAWGSYAPTMPSAGFALKDSEWITSLAPGATKTIALTWTCGSSCGAYPTKDSLSGFRAWIFLDVDGFVAESDETDNVQTVGFDGPFASMSGPKTLGMSSGWSELRTEVAPLALRNLWSGYGVSLGASTALRHTHLATYGL